jgi:hypothetical protein
MKRRTRQQWRELVVGYEGSGQTVSAYCARSRISVGSFYRWRALLDLPQPVPAAVPAVSAVPFVDLGALSSGSTGRMELRLELGHGIVLQLARG